MLQRAQHSGDERDQLVGFAVVWELVARAQRWLRSNPRGDIEIRKWPTRRWGEIPADLGRK